MKSVLIASVAAIGLFAASAAQAECAGHGKTASLPTVDQTAGAPQTPVPTPATTKPTDG